MTTIRQVNQYINTYNKAADAFNKNRKTLAPIARKNTKQGKAAYKKLQKLYAAAIRYQMIAKTALQTYRSSQKPKKAT